MGNNQLFHRALNLERQGNFAEALGLFQYCLDDPTLDEGDVHFHRGWCLENKKSSAQAIASYEMATMRTSIPSCKVNSY